MSCNRSDRRSEYLTNAWAVTGRLTIEDRTRGLHPGSGAHIASIRSRLETRSSIYAKHQYAQRTTLEIHHEELNAPDRKDLRWRGSP